LARSPSAASATPKNIENTTICRISLLAIASANDLGTRWLTKSFSVNLEVARLADAPMSGSGSPRLWPGCSRLAMMRPSTREISEAVMNQPSALPNTRPTEAASPMCAMPTTSVENTSGPISILISRRKTSEMIEM
jgi:hypothetical protein